MSAAAHRSSVTVILPTYNRAAFLPAAFESITGQTWSDWDLVVVDAAATGHIIGQLDAPRAIQERVQIAATTVPKFTAGSQLKASTKG